MFDFLNINIDINFFLENFIIVLILTLLIGIIFLLFIPANYLIFMKVFSLLLSSFIFLMSFIF